MMGDDATLLQEAIRSLPPQHELAGDFFLERLNRLGAEGALQEFRGMEEQAKIYGTIYLTDDARKSMDIALDTYYLRNKEKIDKREKKIGRRFFLRSLAGLSAGTGGAYLLRSSEPDSPSAQARNRPLNKVIAEAGGILLMGAGVAAVGGTAFQAAVLPSYKEEEISKTVASLATIMKPLLDDYRERKVDSEMGYLS